MPGVQLTSTEIFWPSRKMQRAFACCFPIDEHQPDSMVPGRASAEFGALGRYETVRRVPESVAETTSFDGAEIG